jgi:diaminopimelate epimerase
MVDNLSGEYDGLSIEQIQFICDRKFGVGADGLIKINRSEKAEFEVDYYNSDGSKSFCGNGARCAVAFADFLGIQTSNVSFDAFDGFHDAAFNQFEVRLNMSDVKSVKQIDGDYEVYTGSPHYIRFVNNLKDYNIVDFGKSIRYNNSYKTEGINVNLAQIISENNLEVLTYERGVEDETFSCGTGVTAVVLAYAFEKGLDKGEMAVKVKGGDLKIAFNQVEKGVFNQVQLIGPAKFVFKGTIDV